VADPHGTNTFAYDAEGQVTNLVTSYSLPGFSPVSYALDYQYDAVGSVTSRVLRGLSGFTNQIATAYDYDEMGRLTLVTNEHAGAAYTYDVPGRRMTKSYGNGDVTVTDVDVEGRPISISTTNQGALVQGWSYGYNAMGMITSITDSAETRVFEYDAVYRLTGETRASAAGIESIGWTYDAAGNRLNRTSTESAVSYTYNADNELTGMTSADTLTVTGSVEPGTGYSDWYESYAAAGGQAARVSTNTGAFAIPGVPVSEGTNTLVVTVEDVGGNISTQSVTFTRQSLGGTQPFLYDDNGNLVERNVWTNGVLRTYAYAYDMENRLTRVTRDEDPILECWYDAAGRRIAKREVVGAQTNAVQYVWEGWALLAVLDESGNLLESYTRGVGVAYDVGSLVAVHHHDGAYTNQTFYLHNNHRGDVTTVRSGTNTVATYRYRAYGSVRQQAGNYASRLGFSSKETDSSVGMLYFGFRFYDPTSGKWLTPDPIGLSGGLNAYRAFDSNPIVFIDALGLFCGGKWLDRIQTGLDAAGLLPGVGIVPDAGNTIISLLRGNWGDAGLSALAMVPMLGQVATAAKYSDDATALIKLAKRAKRTGVSSDDADTLIKWADEYGLPHRGPEIHPNRRFNKEHIHIGPVPHIPIVNSLENIPF
jgi:RHS repeat-associated protein